MKRLCPWLVPGLSEKILYRNKPLSALSSYMRRVKFSQISMIITGYYIYSIIFNQSFALTIHCQCKMHIEHKVGMHPTA